MEESGAVRERVESLGRASATRAETTSGGAGAESERQALIALGKQAVERWHAVRAQLGADWSFLGDFRPSVCPELQLDSADLAAAEQCRPTQAGFGQNGLPTYFLAWERCTATRHLPNPYEPLMAIWERGGAFRREGNLFELSGSSGPVGGIGWPSGSLPRTAPAPVRDTTPPQRPQGMSDAEWERRQKLAASMRGWSNGAGGRRLPTRRIRAVLVLLLCGSGFVIAALLGDNTHDAASGGLATKYFGPHGNAVTMGLLGGILLIAAILLLVRWAREARAARTDRS